MKVFLFGLLVSVTTLLTSYTPTPHITPKPHGDSVYICVSSGSYAYHSDKNYRGLQKCTHTIKKVSEKEAITTYNRKKCKICY